MLRIKLWHYGHYDVGWLKQPATDNYNQRLWCCLPKIIKISHVETTACQSARIFLRHGVQSYRQSPDTGAVGSRSRMQCTAHATGAVPVKAPLYRPISGCFRCIDAVATTLHVDRMTTATARLMIGHIAFVVVWSTTLHFSLLVAADANKDVERLRSSIDRLNALKQLVNAEQVRL